jgi:hypothetical protein
MEDLGRIYGTYRGQFAKLHAKKQPGQTQVKITKVQAWADQRPTNHASRIIKCPSKTRHFQSLTIKQLTLDSEVQGRKFAGHQPQDAEEVGDVAEVSMRDRGVFVVFAG